NSMTKKEKASSSFYKRIWKTAAPFQKSFAVVMLLTIAIEITNAVRTWYIARGVEQVMKNDFSHENIEMLIVIAITAFSIFIVRNLLSLFWDSYKNKYLDFAFPKYMSQLSLNKYLSFSMGQHMSQHSSISQKIVSDGQSSLQNILELFSNSIVPALGNLFVSLCVLFFVNFYIGLSALIFTIISLILFNRINKWLIPDILEQNEFFRKNNKKVSEAYRNTFLVTVENKKDTIIKRYLESYYLYENKGTSIWLKFFKQYFGLRFYFEFFRWLMYVSSVFLIYKGFIFPGAFLMVYIWTQNVVEGVNQISNSHKRFSMNVADIQKYFELLDKEPEIVDIENPIVMNKFSGEIVFNNVTFSYPKRKSSEIKDEDSDKDFESCVAVKNISFTIESGMKVGIVGESGSGKTTVMNLIRRAFDPTDGLISIDDVPLKNIEQASFRSQLGNVDQNVQLFDTTIKDNILFGVSEENISKISEFKINKVVKMACIDKFEHKLENGLDTQIGEYGIKLSGGERQRIAIARALMKNPSILIFDEATSALDTNNEKLIQDAIDNASAGRTTIIVAHRLSTVKNADKIIVFDKGKIVGEGSHDELIKTCSYYAELVKNQLN
ncbi:MAG: ABC transporter ATP-binding protein, partial [Candidatus Roizmanbacteria bacterium]|nr:ABC transporter ATP-binding protein [Candidatus Roizmanbacteria bacterium]